MFAALQKWPPEALDGDEARYGAVEVLYVGSEKDSIEFLKAYRERYNQACQEWDAFDADHKGEWSNEHTEMFDDLCNKHQIAGLIDDAKFEIVEVFPS